jgi:hypothetical protein
LSLNGYNRFLIFSVPGIEFQKTATAVAGSRNSVVDVVLSYRLVIQEDVVSFPAGKRDFPLFQRVQIGCDPTQPPKGTEAFVLRSDLGHGADHSPL